MVDLSSVAEGEETELLSPRSREGLEVMRHSAAHVMAEAILRLHPGAKLAIGPSIENGFYYDIDLEEKITPEEFPQIERVMKEIVDADIPFVRRELPKEEALHLQREAKERYKVENILAADSDVISFYSQGDGFEDVCRGPHVPSTGRIGHFKLLSVAGAYWRGDVRKTQLQRVYGTTWPTKEELDDYLRRLEEAKKRDHRRLGKELDLYSIHEEIGPGLIFWHPKLSIVRRVIEEYWYEEHRRRGYQPVYAPHIASERIFEISGHLEKYSEMMYSPMDIDGSPYRLKPMNCPGHIMIYKTRIRSYRDLPIRYCELGTVYRYEPSGTLHGMLRVRGFTQDDAHVFCTPEQLVSEVVGIIELVEYMMKDFGYEYRVFLATMPEKHLGTEEEWERSTKALKEALKERGLDYEIDEGGGVFYAPKIDFKLLDSLGREWQGPTVQVDLNLPKRFKVAYIGADNSPHETVMIHRAILGSLERFVGALIEHYGGAFPPWLAPEQARVASVTSGAEETCGSVARALEEKGFRVGTDVRPERIALKVREWRLERVPYLLVVGKREMEKNTVNVRSRERELGEMTVDGFAEDLSREVAGRARP